MVLGDKFIRIPDISDTTLLILFMAAMVYWAADKYGRRKR